MGLRLDRLSGEPAHTWPDHIVDVKRALAWIKEHIAEYGGDPDFVAISGGSAGGHLSALAALTADDPQYQPGFEDADTSVVAAVPIYGRYDWFSAKGTGPLGVRLVFLQQFVVKKPIDAEPAGLSSMRRRSPGCGPTLRRSSSCTGRTIRSSRWPRHASSWRRCGRSRTTPVVYAEIPHAQHAFDFFGSPRGYYTAQAVEKFLSWVHAKREARQLSYCAIAVSMTVSSSESPAARRISMNASTIASVSSCGSCERRAVGQHRDVELVDVAPHRDVQPAAGRQRTRRSRSRSPAHRRPGRARGARARWRSEG